MNIFEQAREMGISLRESDVYQSYLKAQDDIMTDQQAQNLVTSYGEIEDKIKELMTQGKSDEVNAYVAQYNELQKQMNENNTLQAFHHAQAEFQDIMNQVNRIIMHQLGIEIPDNEGCGGSCESCGGGCNHH